MLHGAYAAYGLSYGLGTFNGIRASEREVDDHKDIAARIAWSPFYQKDAIVIKGLHLGFSTTYGEEEMAFPDDKDAYWNKGKLETAGDTKFFEFSNGVIHDGKTRRLGTELAWVGITAIVGRWSARCWEPPQARGAYRCGSLVDCTTPRPCGRRLEDWPRHAECLPRHRQGSRQSH